MIQEDSLRTYLLPLLAQLPQAVCPIASFKEIAGNEMPPPYRQLLVHTQDMTSNLENFFDEKIRIQVLRSAADSGIYSRCVLLMLKGSDRIVEFGGIDIYLDNYPPEARKLILEESEPLGGIMNSLGMSYLSQPRCYIEAENTVLQTVMPTKGPRPLYGRCNKLSTPEGAVLARIVEILPRLEP